MQEKSFSDEIPYSEDIVTSYLNASGKFDLLSAEEEIELAKQIETGLYATYLLDKESSSEFDDEHKNLLGMIAIEGVKARQKMINANTRLAVSIASKYKNVMYHNQFSDLINDANLGLISAVDRFDYKKGYRFSTYATLLINQSVHKRSNDSEREIKMSSLYAETHAKIRSVRKEYEDRTGETPNDSYVASQLGNIDEDYIKKIDTFMHTTETISLNTPISGPSGATDQETLQDFVTFQQDTQYASAEEAYDETYLTATLRRVIKTHLDTVNSFIVSKKLGLDGKEPMSYQQIGDIIGISKQNIAVRYNKSIKRLSQLPEITSLHVYLED